MKDSHAFIGVIMLVLLGGSIAEFAATHKALCVGICLAVISGIFIYSVIKKAKISK